LYIKKGVKITFLTPFLLNGIFDQLISNLKSFQFEQNKQIIHFKFYLQELLNNRIK